MEPEIYEVGAPDIPSIRAQTVRYEAAQARIVATVIGVGTLISGVLAVGIILSVLIISLYNPDKEPPKVLENWGGIILGFYFGQFLSLVKDYMHSSERRSDSASS
jgi:hypothetical protein